MLKCSMILAAAFELGLAAPSVGQERPGAVESRVIAGLASRDMSVRIRTYTGLSDDDLAKTVYRRALRDLLVLENRVVDSLNLLGFGTSEKLGEGWGEYLAEVVDACAKHCDRADPQVLRALATTAYNPDGEFAVRLAHEHGREILPVLLERIGGRNGIARSSAIAMLATVQEQALSLQDEDKAAIHDAIIRSLAEDVDVGSRIAAIWSLGRIGTRADLATLRRISETDNMTSVGLRGTEYPLRQAAEAAMARISARP